LPGAILILYFAKHLGNQTKTPGCKIREPTGDIWLLDVANWSLNFLGNYPKI